jgi:hypothetical protein
VVRPSFLVAARAVHWSSRLLLCTHRSVAVPTTAMGTTIILTLCFCCRCRRRLGQVLHQQLQHEGAAEGARPTGSAALKPVDLDYIRNVVVKLLETEEIETYLCASRAST